MVMGRRVCLCSWPRPACADMGAACMHGGESVCRYTPLGVNANARGCFRAHGRVPVSLRVARPRYTAAPRLAPPLP